MFQFTILLTLFNKFELINKFSSKKPTIEFFTSCSFRLLTFLYSISRHPLNTFKYYFVGFLKKLLLKEQLKQNPYIN